MDNDTHAHYIANAARDFIYAKYHIGLKEHGGRLDRKRVVEKIREESADQWVYIQVLSDQLDDIKELLIKALGEDNLMRCKDSVDEALMILTIGNSEGELEEDH